jgi:hypothetical protein
MGNILGIRRACRYTRHLSAEDVHQCHSKSPMGASSSDDFAIGLRLALPMGSVLGLGQATVAYSLSEKPQHVYSVRFSARELWGEQAAPQDAVYLDLYDDYLEPA